MTAAVVLMACAAVRAQIAYLRCLDGPLVSKLYVNGAVRLGLMALACFVITEVSPLGAGTDAPARLSSRAADAPRADWGSAHEAARFRAEAAADRAEAAEGFRCEARTTAS